jgi:hypothetical protein
MTFGTTKVDDGRITAPQILNGDLFSHITLIRSFSFGYNFPTEYPFQQGEGIRYHFLFYFGGGLLEALGASLSMALNLPSALGLGSSQSLRDLWGAGWLWRLLEWRRVSLHRDSSLASGIAQAISCQGTSHS